MIVVLATFVNHRRRILLLVRFWLRALGKPGSFCNPFVIQLSRLRDGKEALRHARAESLVHDAEIERHRNGSRLEGFGIVELATHHDGDRNEVSFAFIGNLDQSERAGALIGVLALAMLRELLGAGFGYGRKEDETNRHQQRAGADDGAEAHAI